MIKQFYTEEWKWFKAKFLKIFIFVIVIFILSSALSHVFLVNHPDQAKRIFTDLAKLFKKIAVQEAGFKACLVIFLHNFRAALLVTVLGLIPFLFLPILGALGNGFVAGVVTSVAHLKGVKLVPGLLFGIAPHGIFELPAILYATSIGICLSLLISKRILLGYHSNEEPLFPLFKQISKTFVGVIVPLLLVAAIIEAFVTPIFIKIFLER